MKTESYCTVSLSSDWVYIYKNNERLFNNELYDFSNFTTKVTFEYEGKTIRGGLAFKNIRNDFLKRSVFSEKGFPVICLDRGDYLEDVITGRKYDSANKKVAKGIINRKIVPISTYTGKILLKPYNNISLDAVVNILKNLNEEDIKEYVSTLDKLERGMYEAFNNYKRLQDEARNNEIKQQNDNESFLLNFRKKYNQRG